MKFWFDTEFIEDGHTIDLVSIGIVAEDGREYYAESGEAKLTLANDWVKANVIPRLQGGEAVKSRGQIRKDVKSFARWKPEFWGFYSSYDWVVLCQLFGRMIDLPNSWPMWCRDVKQLCVDRGDPRLPKSPAAEHHALADARWVREAYLYLADLEAVETHAKTAKS